MKNVFKLLTILALAACLGACKKEKDDGKIHFNSIEIYNQEDPVCIRVDQEYSMYIQVEPIEGDDELMCTFTEPGVAECTYLSKTGVVIKGLKEGSTMMLISTPEGVSDAITVVVDIKYREAKDMLLDHESVTIEKGDYESVEFQMIPEGCDDPIDEEGHPAILDWTIEDTKIARVDWAENEYCDIEGVSVGKTKLICTWGKFRKECEVIVKETIIPVTGINIPEGNTSVEMSQPYLVLTAEISPDNASNKAVKWLVGDTNVIEFVGTTGNKGGFMVIGPGKTNVTAIAAGTDIKKTVAVEVKAPPVPEGAVDLGHRRMGNIPVYFSKYNLGSEHEADAGKLYAWADPECYYASKNPYVWKSGKEGGYVPDNYKWYDKKTKKYLKYNYEGGLTALELEDDPARKALGGKWRSISSGELWWLTTYCDWKESQVQGVRGMTLTSKVPGFEGNSIFLPCGGYINGTDNYADGNFENFMGNRYYMGCYFGSDLYHQDEVRVWSLVFYDGEIFLRGETRWSGHSIRPVWEGYNL